MYHIICEYSRDVLGEKFSPHTGRATVDSKALRNGADLVEVQELLGHVNIATTRLYDERSTASEEECAGAKSMVQLRDRTLIEHAAFGSVVRALVGRGDLDSAAALAARLHSPEAGSVD